MRGKLQITENKSEWSCAKCKKSNVSILEKQVVVVVQGKGGCLLAQAYYLRLPRCRALPGLLACLPR